MTLEIAVFLSMNGRAGEALAFYKKHLSAEELLVVTYEDMAKRDDSFLVTEENKQFISHSVLQIGQTKLMIAEDSMDPTQSFKIGTNFSLCIQSADLVEIETFYSNLTSDDRVKIIVPLNQNVFSGAYGIVEDPFGVQIQLMHDERLK
ncbi:PhnB protein [Enterococcus sp. DIV0840]|uniref:VOC family protein n=1 Tax=Enterococcus TaxID=1350 RepID=UPI001A8E0A75|nr:MULTISPECIES: VOC family protein [Enterococcus]MBO0433400.1 VOC family protein [Enterococcus sp. DIV0849a]MBO0472529.1 VOC family protein [Enterococcus ureasiticus]